MVWKKIKMLGRKKWPQRYHPDATIQMLPSWCYHPDATILMHPSRYHRSNPTIPTLVSQCYCQSTTILMLWSQCYGLHASILMLWSSTTILTLPSQCYHQSTTVLTLLSWCYRPKATVPMPFLHIKRVGETSLHITAQQDCISNSTPQYSNHKMPPIWLSSVIALLPRMLTTPNIIHYDKQSYYHSTQQCCQ